ncbi:MAG: cytochrome c [Alphaproteobacteria bacterium]
MTSRVRVAVLAVALGLALTGTATVSAQDANPTVSQRQDRMKAIGRALGAVRAYTEDKGDLAAARAGGAELVNLVADIPALFPQRTGMTEFPGTSYAKPEIWAQWQNFTQAAQQAHASVVALNTALATGDKAAITAAFQAVGRDGCTGCHRPFRQPKS